LDGSNFKIKRIEVKPPNEVIDLTLDDGDDPVASGNSVKVHPFFQARKKKRAADLSAQSVKGSEQQAFQTGANQSDESPKICSRHNCKEGELRKNGQRVTFNLRKRDGHKYGECDQCKEHSDVKNPASNKKVRVMPLV
jgi:hypothetical protein